MSLFCKELFRLHGTTLKMRTAYHLESDGQTKVLNWTLETYLCCFCSEQPKVWVNYVGWV